MVVWSNFDPADLIPQQLVEEAGEGRGAALTTMRIKEIASPELDEEYDDYATEFFARPDQQPESADGEGA